MTTAAGASGACFPVAALVGAGALALAGVLGRRRRGVVATARASSRISARPRTPPSSTRSRPSRRTVCAAEEKAAPLTPDTSPGTQWDQQLQLLAEPGRAVRHVDGRGHAVAHAAVHRRRPGGQPLRALDKLGVADKILPAARSTIKALYGGDDLYALPTELNIEGFWYNKQLLADNGIEAPDDVGRPRRRRRDAEGAPASSRSPPPARTAGPSPASSATTSSATSVPMPCRRSPTARPS